MHNQQNYIEHTTRKKEDICFLKKRFQDPASKAIKTFDYFSFYRALQILFSVKFLIP